MSRWHWAPTTVFDSINNGQRGDELAVLWSQTNLLSIVKLMLGMQRLSSTCTSFFLIGNWWVLWKCYILVFISVKKTLVLFEEMQAIQADSCCPLAKVLWPITRYARLSCHCCTSQHHVTCPQSLCVFMYYDYIMRIIMCIIMCIISMAKLFVLCGCGCGCACATGWLWKVLYKNKALVQVQLR